MTLAMLSLAFLTVCAAAVASPAPAPPDPYHHAHHNGPIALTTAEIRRLFNALIIAPLRALLTTPHQAANHAHHWSNWRRLHQGRARRSHCRRRLAIAFSP